MVVAQLVEQSLPIPEVRGSNPVIGKNLFILKICLLSTVNRKDENKEKEAGNGPFVVKIVFLFEKTENKLKEAGVGPFFKKVWETKRQKIS